MLRIAFDEGPGIGLGHRRRVEAVARELARLGVECRMTALNGEAIVGEAVLVDSYNVRADDHAKIDAALTIAIDDIERDLAIDMVVDPDPGADGRVHEHAASVLAGAPYALIDPAFRTHPRPEVRTEVRRVLVTTGAADADGVGARIASDLARALDATEVRLVVGPWATSTDDARVRVINAPAGLASELAAADLVITAGGVTMLESCCLARPTVAVSVAPNQTRAIAGAAHAGAVLAADVSSACGVATHLAHDVDARRRLAMSAGALVDGQGATRVASAIATITSQGIHAR